MAWITSDEQVANSLREYSGQPVHVRDGDALDMAIATNADSVVLLPAANGAASVVVIHWNERPSAPVETEPPASEPEPVQKAEPKPPQPEPEPRHELVATGLLGLTDAIEYEEEPQKPKKWWQKLLD
jgi:hypothetical protein